MMIRNNMRPVHPGEILREEPKINDIVRERRGITPDTALRLSRYFGGDAQTWLNLQSAYELKTTQESIAADLEAIVPMGEAA